MAFGLFGKNKSEDKSEDAPIRHDPRKARPWFERAKTVADTRNYDYAIECYINGLRHDLDNLGVHEALHNVALKRKVAGGKPPGFTEKLSSGGRTPMDKLLHSEMLWAKDPVNLQFALSIMDYCVQLNETHDELHMGEVAHWVGGIAMDLAVQPKKGSKSVFVRLMDLFERIEIYDKAVEACRRALQFAENDSELLRKLKDLQAMLSMKAGRYEEGARASIRDTERQRDLEQRDSTIKSASVKDEVIQRRRAEYEEDPNDPDRVQRLVQALVDKGDFESETEAIRLLNELWQTSGQYRFKVRIGDIRMGQFNRELRKLKTMLEKDPQNQKIKQKVQDLAVHQVKFELGEYEERVKNYPTDMGLRYQYGRRLHAVRKYDEAIAEFQQARHDPKHRASSLLYLGRCYVAKDWMDEAVSTFSEAVKLHDSTGDKLALELRYEQMDTLDKLARRDRKIEHAREAQKIASEILQANINFRDIRQRLDEVRKLVQELESSADPA
ncbi:MAG: hypothetical protein JJU36_15515 [Phycisphaeraceae bacterium]|nr:hypothetical protein [Phycisphaeraceae bacterium]